MWYILTMEYYSAMGRNEVVTHVTTWEILKMCQVKEASHKRPPIVCEDGIWTFASEKIISHLSCLRKLLEDVLHKKEGVNYEKGRLRTENVTQRGNSQDNTKGKSQNNLSSVEPEYGGSRQSVSRKEWNEKIS